MFVVSEGFGPAGQQSKYYEASTCTDGKKKKSLWGWRAADSPGRFSQSSGWSHRRGTPPCSSWRFLQTCGGEEGKSRRWDKKTVGQRASKMKTKHTHTQKKHRRTTGWIPGFCQKSDAEQRMWECCRLSISALYCYGEVGPKAGEPWIDCTAEKTNKTTKSKTSNCTQKVWATGNRTIDLLNCTQLYTNYRAGSSARERAYMWK